MNIDRLEKIKGLGKKGAIAIVQCLPEFYAFVKEAGLENKLKYTPEIVEDTGHPLFGKKIVLTEIKGKELERFIESKGGEVGKSMSKKVFLVVKKDENTNTEKANAAELLGIRSMTEAEFRATYML